MKQALISPNEVVFCATGLTPDKELIFSEIPNSARVAQVAETPFEVAPPLFWVDCADNITADDWYWDKTTFQFVAIPIYVPPVTNDLPVTVV